MKLFRLEALRFALVTRKWLVCPVALTVILATAVAQQGAARSTPKAFDFLGLGITVLVSSEDTAGASALMDIEIPAQSGPGPHIHTREDEVYTIKRGTFQFYMDGVCLQAGPGAALYLPKEHIHAFRNITQGAGELLLFVYPAGLDRYFREVHDIGLKMPQDLSKLDELSERKYGLTYQRKHEFHPGACRVIAAHGASGV